MPLLDRATSFQGLPQQFSTSIAVVATLAVNRRFAPDRFISFIFILFAKIRQECADFCLKERYATLAAFLKSATLSPISYCKLVEADDA
jgi:hypothetical protein